MILLDTHVLVWMDEGSGRLGKIARNQIEEAFSRGEAAVSAISFWEVAMLVEKQRLEISMDLDSWRRSLLSAGLVEVAISGLVGIKAAELKSFHGDPADRMIVATALHGGMVLATADQKILDYSSPLSTLNAQI